MSEMVTPRVSIPSVCPPTVMIVAAWVSCLRFRVNRSPFFVVTSSESGMGPTVRDMPGRQEAWAAEFITSPMPRSAMVGPKHTAAMMRAARILRISGHQPLRQGLVDAGHAQQTAVIEGRLAGDEHREDRKSTRLNSSHVAISYAVFCLKKKK